MLVIIIIIIIIIKLWSAGHNDNASFYLLSITELLSALMLIIYAHFKIGHDDDIIDDQHGDIYHLLLFICFIRV